MTGLHAAYLSAHRVASDNNLALGLAFGMMVIIITIVALALIYAERSQRKRISEECARLRRQRVISRTYYAKARRDHKVCAPHLQAAQKATHALLQLEVQERVRL